MPGKVATILPHLRAITVRYYTPTCVKSPTGNYKHYSKHQGIAIGHKATPGVLLLPSVCASVQGTFLWPQAVGASCQLAKHSLTLFVCTIMSSALISEGHFC